MAARSSGRERREVGALREVLAQQPVGVLVRAALPRPVRIAEVDSSPVSRLKLRVVGHLGALVPGERSAQLVRQRGDHAGDRFADRLGSVPGERWSVLEHGARRALPSEADGGAS